MKALFISPHDDDSTLFGAFSIMRDNCDVLVVYDSYVQVTRGADWCDRRTRHNETDKSLAVMGIGHHKRCGLRDDVAYEVDRLRDGFNFIGYDRFYIPRYHSEGHAQHNLVSLAAQRAVEKLEPYRSVIFYGTYTTQGKMKLATEVVPTPDMIQRKLRALACYESQIRLENTREHFLRELKEYIEVPRDPA